MKRITESEMQK
jgi:hypothetical protein